MFAFTRDLTVPFPSEREASMKKRRFFLLDSLLLAATEDDLHVVTALDTFPLHARGAGILDIQLLALKVGYMESRHPIHDYKSLGPGFKVLLSILVHPASHGLHLHVPL